MAPLRSHIDIGHMRHLDCTEGYIECNRFLLSMVFCVFTNKTDLFYHLRFYCSEYRRFADSLVLSIHRDIYYLRRFAVVCIVSLQQFLLACCDKMVLNFNVRLFCENLRATKPPYECPVDSCGKVYRTYTGIENHMYNYDHGSAAGPSAPAVVTSAVPGLRNPGGQQRSSEHPQLQLDPLLLSKPNKMIEVDLGTGQPCKVNVLEPLRVIVGDGDGKCSESAKDHNRSSTIAAKECSSRKDVCGAVSSSYPSPSNKLPEASFRVMSDFVRPKEFPTRPGNYYRYVPKTTEEMEKEVEYDMDEMVSKISHNCFDIVVLVNYRIILLLWTTEGKDLHTF